jgi:hypothetical protein
MAQLQRMAALTKSGNSPTLHSIMTQLSEGTLQDYHIVSIFWDQLCQSYVVEGTHSCPSGGGERGLVADLR